MKNNEKCYYTVNIAGNKMMLVYLTHRQRDLLCSGAKKVNGIDFSGFVVLHTTGRGFSKLQAVWSHKKDIIKCDFAGTIVDSIEDITDYTLLDVDSIVLSGIVTNVTDKINEEKCKNDFSAAQGEIIQQIRIETRMAQLDNILKIVKYFNMISLIDQNNFINSLYNEK